VFTTAEWVIFAVVAVAAAYAVWQIYTGDLSVG